MVEVVEEQSPAATHAGHVLVVDDEPEYLSHVYHLLKRHNYTLKTVERSADVLSVLARERFDLVILDVLMPGMDGLSVLQAIRKTWQPVDLPVVLFTGADVPGAKLHGFQLGANDYIDKFEPPGLLLARIEILIRSKRLEDERQQAMRELRSLEQLQASMVYMATHDLKDELNIIQMAADMLAEVHSDSDTQRQVSNILDSITASERLINTFMDINRLRSGHLEINLADLRLLDIVQAVVSKYQVSLDRKNQQAHVNVNANVFFVGDEARTIQALSNLFNNAIKYSPMGSKISLTSCICHNGMVRLTVKDHGPGIAPDERRRLFGLYARLSTRPTANEKSNGVGLWIAKTLVEHMSGQIGADFPDEGGSRFWIELPQAENMKM
jgi:signal transduction histidine kinase